MADEADVLIVGGGAAGMSAALVLGRALRRAIVLDAGAPRNLPTPHAHGFLTRDGTPPAELAALARAQLERYESVRVVEARAASARQAGGRFEVRDATGKTYAAPRVILATGVRERLPAIEGLAERWGASVFHCPYCHGFEYRGRPFGVLATGATAARLGRVILAWTDDAVVFTDGERLADAERGKLARMGVPVHEARVTRLAGEGRELAAVELDDGTRVERAALLLHPPQTPATDLARELGCALDEAGYVKVDEWRRTSVEGVYAAGDCARPDMQQLVLAAADGATAALHLNNKLLEEELL